MMPVELLSAVARSPCLLQGAWRKRGRAEKRYQYKLKKWIVPTGFAQRVPPIKPPIYCLDKKRSYRNGYFNLSSGWGPGTRLNTGLVVFK
jgi:hypothetical protein